MLVFISKLLRVLDAKASNCVGERDTTGRLCICENDDNVQC